MQEENKIENTNHQNAGHNNDKLWNALAYVLFFIPLLINPKPADGKFHANQGLNLLIVNIVGSIIISMIPIVRNFSFIFTIFIFVLFVMGILNAFNNKKVKLPVVGGIFELIK